jgi:hypothetical protein
MRNYRTSKGFRRGFVIGELLLALLLLTVAVSSLAALMYSVSRRPPDTEKIPCVARPGSAPGKCTAPAVSGNTSRLLRSGCAAKVGNGARSCSDPVPSEDSSAETIIKSRTDSASLAQLAKKQKTRTERTDRGFVR